VSAVKPLAGHEDVEIVPTLLIAGWPEGESTGGTSLHGVVVFLVSLDVLSVLDTTVLGVVGTKTSDDGSRAQSLGHTKSMREGVEPKIFRKTISMIILGGKCSKGVML
jgi:hypothetical protein